MAGVEDTGFSIKPFQEIKNEFEATIRSISGQEDFNVRSSSMMGQIIGVSTKQLYDVWQAALDTYLSRHVSTAQGKSLDHIVSVGGLERQSGFRTSGVVYFEGDAGTSIPAGTIVSTPTDLNFETQEAVVLADGVQAQFKIKKEPGNSATSFKITVEGGFGSRFEDIEGNEQTLSYTATDADIETAFDALLGGTGVIDSISKNDNEITITLSDKDFLPEFLIEDGEVEIVRAGLPDGASVGVSAISEGALVVRAYEVSEINAPINGLDAVINLNTFITGRLAETDAELRTRWNRRVEAPALGASRTIKNELENLSGVSQALIFEGRSEFEVVISGGDDQEIANTIERVKAPGDLTAGNTSKEVEDVNGNPKLIFFSRPTIKPIYFNITITTESGFPAGGEEDARGAVINYVNSFRIGGSVRPLEIILALGGIAGIVDIDVQLSETGADGSFSDNPIQLLNREKVSLADLTISLV